MRRARVLIVAAVLAAGLAVAGVASADPDFGPGASSKKHNDPGAVCTPSPTLDADLAQCK